MEASCFHLPVVTRQQVFLHAPRCSRRLRTPEEHLCAYGAIRQSTMRDLNPRRHFGRVKCCRYTNGTWSQRPDLNGQPIAYKAIAPPLCYAGVNRGRGLEPRIYHDGERTPSLMRTYRRQGAVRERDKPAQLGRWPWASAVEVPLKCASCRT